MTSIYRSPEGKARILELYDRAVEALGTEVEERWVETRSGRTHVLVAGPREGPPLVLFQGGNVLNPMSLAWFRPLAEAWRVHAPDTVGHPGRSAETRPAPRLEGYGRWAGDVLDGLGLGRVPVVGLSHGAAVALGLATVAPERIERAALVVPAGIVGISPLGLARLSLPMLAYRFLPRSRAITRGLSSLFAEPPPELWLDVLDAIAKHVRVEREMPGPVTPDDLAGLRAPVLVIAAEDDVLFPARDVLPRAAEVFPSRVEAERLPGARHVLGRGDVRRVNERIEAFLGG